MATNGGQVQEPLPGMFEITSCPLEGAPGVLLRGEVDVSSVQHMSEVMEAEIRASEGAFVVDLCELEFLDSSGLSALMRVRALLGREDRALAVICPHGPVRRLFDVSGVADLLFLYESREAAAAALVPPAGS